MAQTTTLQLPNSSGAAFRASLNQALAALFSSNSGATAPTSTYPGMPWLDTSLTPPQLKIRNAADDTWIVAHRESLPAYNFWGNPTSAPAAPAPMTPAEAREALGFDQSIAADGWVQLPGGLLIQWGVIVSTGSGVTFNFPTSFPTAVLSVVGTGHPSIAGGRQVTMRNASTSAVTVYGFNDDGSPAGSLPVNILAVGY